MRDHDEIGSPYIEGFRDGKKSAIELMTVNQAVDFMLGVDLYDRIVLIDMINKLSADLGFKAVPNG